MLPGVAVPDLARFDWPAARLAGSLATTPRMSVAFLKAALPPSWRLTGKTAVRRLSAGVPFVQVQPAALPGRRGARRSFWGAAPAGAAVGTPRQKVCWQTPHMCLVPPAGSGRLVPFRLAATVTAMTEPRGVATRGERSYLDAALKTATSQAGKFGVRRLDIGGHIWVSQPPRRTTRPWSALRANKRLSP
jgi:hypothetical protein